MVWSVKHRRKVLKDDIAKRLKELIIETAKEKGFTVQLCEIGNTDHVHCFVTAPPTMSISLIIKHLKGISGRKLFIEFPELKNSLWNGELWNHSYYVETIGSVSEENIKKYIKNQETKY
jgi:putative transposase